jgi:hypothetical protein
MEKVFYEMRPFMYMGLALYAIFWHQNSILMQVSGGLLLICSFFIFTWRAKHRGYLGN